MKVQIGKGEFQLGSEELTELRDSTELLGSVEQLRTRMEEDGYLLLRGFHDRAQVLRARSQILAKLAADGKFAEETDPEEAIIGPLNKGAFYGGTNEDLPEFLELVNSARVMQFFQDFLGGEPMTYPFKWLRAVAQGDNTAAHYDIVYMGRGTPNLYTMWTPLGDTPIEMGTLAVLEGSHRWQNLRETYGRMDVDRDGTGGWFSDDPHELIEKFGGRWATSSFQAGDVMIFGMFTMHASTVNTSNKMRVSCDTRYQLASEPADDRWIGKKPKGHRPAEGVQNRTMAEAREKWGL
ncbi:phytanoyl-CoA dioxygenase family protein [Paenibacillus gansuensis]|uniref:Phytanoyl-CoA dioxygenase family protein n=1 Tax=Paenibacillus gansuensis TaxID=306542 RepID=A0ABW5PGJ1_9BACL